MVNQKTKIIVLMGLFIALSFVGANIKVPSPTGTVAFDSAPGFLAALFLGPIYGAITAALGHIFTSLFAGFPLSFPIHLYIALQMAVFAAIYSYISKRNLVLGTIVAIFLNGVGAPALFIPFRNFGIPFFAAMVIPLLVGSFANIAASSIIYKSIQASSKALSSKTN